ncbi:hypothetical protein CAPTEDRAFT_206908 [Capitella teleta]|uniref:NR LBD domain-containing protein n=1 Tax=Capitella teleta TaxID=283909 RepID=R7VCT0_CAPTE|nr:hypothetical protein CAPTEDRAFT_206908 [Capitella teleta]|eukprot:ELU16444.1 hypothetical protein CAPTEDRAFT_206908 [Capitella teleta]
MCRLHDYLNHNMHKEISLKQLYNETGDILLRITRIVFKLGKLKITQVEFVLLKVILLFDKVNVSSHKESIDALMSEYQATLSWYISQNFDSSSRGDDFSQILAEIEEAAGLLLDSKMIYIPFLLN